jgi:hypothetical protein
MSEIDPNLWASLARQYTGGVAMPTSDQDGYVAVAKVSADAINLEYLPGTSWIATTLPGSATGEILAWNNTSGAWEVPSNVLAGSGFISLGAAPATAGAVRLTNDEFIYGPSTGAANYKIAGVASDDSIQFGDENAAYNYSIAATSWSAKVAGSDRWTVSETLASSTVPLDMGGKPIQNVHTLISPATAQTVAAAGSPAYVNLQLNGSTTSTSLYGGFGVPQPSGGSVLSKAVIGFRVEWREDTTGATMYTDELQFGVGWREDSNDLYVQAALVNTAGDGEGAANANVTVVTYGGSGAQYRLTLQADGTIYLAMMQDASTARRVMVATFRGESIRNMI